MKGLIKSDAEAIGALAEIATTEGTRYAIDSVAIEKDGERSIAVATDGRALAVVRLEATLDTPELNTKFPPWRDVVPPWADGSIAVRLNPVLLQKILKVVEVLEVTQEPECGCESTRPTPIVLVIHPKALGVAIVSCNGESLAVLRKIEEKDESNQKIYDRVRASFVEATAT